jgi:hypothetical protein
MIKSDEKLNRLSKILNTRDITLVTEAIEQLREEQPFEGAIGLLTSYYNNNDDNSIRKTIGEFMNDLKDQAITAEIINEIRKKWNPSTISMLISSCWQSGLDYSEYCTDLANVFIEGDYVTALECLTVIEESAQGLTRKKKDAIIKIIDERPVSMLKEKAELKLELLSILAR